MFWGWDHRRYRGCFGVGIRGDIGDVLGSGLIGDIGDVWGSGIIGDIGDVWGQGYRRYRGYLGLGS